MKTLNIKLETTARAKKLSNDLEIAWTLVQQFPYDAGFDLRACILEAIILKPTESIIIPTGFHIEMSAPHWEMQVRSRSGLAAKYNVIVANSPGTVDYMYREEVKVILLNLGNSDLVIKPGDRIAQACFREVPEVSISVVEEIEKTPRSGFGSTGNS